VWTLPCKLPHAKHVKCNALSSVDCGWLSVGGSEKSLFCGQVALKEPVVYSRCSKWCPSPSRMHAVMLSSDQRPCQWCSTECFSASSRWYRNFTSEQNKVSKREVVQKVIPVANFWMSADDTCKKLWKLVDVC